MKTIKEINTALAIFEEASIKHAEATETGDYKTGNIHHDEIAKAAAFIKNKNVVDRLKPFLSHSSIGVRLWAACYLLPVDEKKSLKTLEEIAKSLGIHALTADKTLSEWKKSNINF